MKKILLAFFIFCAIVSKAQIYTPMKGTQITYLKVDSGFAVTFRDTVIGRGVNRPGLIVCRPQDSLFYGYNGVSWHLLGDTSSAISLKVDSVTVSGDTLYYWINGASVGWVLPTAGWKIDGNTGISPTEFIGTLDAADLIFKVDNIESGKLTTDGKTSFGHFSLAFLAGATAIGYLAEADALNSTALGHNAQASADSGTAIGVGANSVGQNAIALGDSVNAKVGIRTGSPAYPLDVRGQVRIKDGSEGAAKVFTSDANGVGTWTTASGSTNNPIGSGYKIAVNVNAASIKSLSQKYGIVLDSATTGEIGIKLDSATVFPVIRTYIKDTVQKIIDYLTMDSVTQFATFSSYAKTVFVKDTLRGGTFQPYSGTDTADNYMVFSDALSRKWMRFVQDGTLNARWFKFKALDMVRATWATSKVCVRRVT